MYLPEPEFLLNILKKMGISNTDHVHFISKKKLLIFILWLRLQRFILHLNF